MTTSFEKLIARYRIRATVRTVTALRIGAGSRDGMAGTDLPVVRDGMGRPYVPGSSFKGAARSAMEAVIRGVGSPALTACDIFLAPCTRELDKRGRDRRDKAAIAFEDVAGCVCTICSLFGSPYLAGRLFVHDLPHSGSGREVAVQLRDGVCIDRDLDRPVPQGKYDYEAVPPGTDFALTMLIENPSALELALSLKMLELLDEGEILLGGFTTRGLGRVRLVEGAEIGRTTAQRLLKGEGYEALSYVEQQTLCSRILDEAIR